MKRPNLLSRWKRLGRPRQALLVEAAAALAVASGALRLLPFKRAVRLGSTPLAEDQASSVIGDARWAVDAASRNLPWRTVCIQKGIALQWMLRRRGVDARLHYGVALDGAGELEAHVWVAEGDQVIIGGEEAPRFQRVATFP